MMNIRVKAVASIAKVFDGKQGITSIGSISDKKIGSREFTKLIDSYDSLSLPTNFKVIDVEIVPIDATFTVDDNLADSIMEYVKLTNTVDAWIA